MEHTTLLSSEEKNELLEILTFRNNLMEYIGIEKLIEEMSDIIDKSEHFDFRNESARKYIDKDKPFFVIKVSTTEGITNLPTIDRNSSDSDLNRYRDVIYKYVGNEIVSESSKLFDKHILNNENLKAKFEKLNTELKDVFLSNIFGVSISSPLDNMIHLRVIV
jgi:hypothetical protein